MYLHEDRTAQTIPGREQFIRALSGEETSMLAMKRDQQVRCAPNVDGFH
jgi:hypothetical protein